MSYELKGTIKVINDAQTFPSGFTKQEFVVTTDDKYPQDIKLEALKDNVELLAPLKVGDTVNVSFDVRGNEFNGKYYVNLVAWKIKGEQRQQERMQQSAQPATQSFITRDGEEESIPF